MPIDRSPLKPNQIVRVSATSDPGAVGGALAHALRRSESVIMSVIGAAAVNQAIKGLAVAVEHMADEGVQIAMVPSFQTLNVDGQERTSLNLKVIRLPA